MCCLIASTHYHMACWSVFLLLVLSNSNQWAHGQQVPCFFIFGDSLSDSGNNNRLSTTSKANFLPYGIDFPGGPTGRFTNGRTLVDVIAQHLGFKDFIPPFLGKGKVDVRKGVNYASGAAGIRDETGQHRGDRITMNEQLKIFDVTIGQLDGVLGKTNKSAAEYLPRCLFTVGIGSNDYINNYLLPDLYPTSKQYTPERYAAVLVNQYSSQLKTLYQKGARKVAILGVGLIGCAPAELAAFGPSPGSTCVDAVNAKATLFNTRLIKLVADLNKKLKNAKFTYINISGIGSSDPKAAGFTVTDSGCCGGQKGCRPNTTPCQNRNQYAFWDEFHPTEAINLLFAARAYKAATPSDASPFDISTLANL